MKETCYPDIPDPYKSSVLSLLKPKVNAGKCVDTIHLLNSSPGRAAVITCTELPGKTDQGGQSACPSAAVTGGCGFVSSIRGTVNLQLP